MVFTTEDKILIKNLVLLKDYSSRQLIKEFLNKGWKKNGLDNLLRKIRATDSVDRKPGSGRPRSMPTAEKIKREQWRPRLRACIRAKGEHFEQLLN